MKKPKILMLHRQPTAVGYYRTIVPARLLREMGYDVTYFEDSTYHKKMRPSIEEWVRRNLGKFQLIIADRFLESGDLGIFSGLKYHSADCRMIVDFDDDFCDLPWWNPSKKFFKPGMAFRQLGLAHMKMAEMATVSTDHLAKVYKDSAHHIAVAPNYIDPQDWVGHPVNPHRASDPHFRILYGGARGHFGDLDEVRAGLEAIIENPPVPFRLICFGAIPAWLHEARMAHPERVVSIPWTEFKHYARMVAWGGFDLAIAPLAEHPFNEAKSNIKWLEATIQGIPFMCSDVGPYADIPNGCAIKVGNSAVQWAEGLREVMKDKRLSERILKRATEACQERTTAVATQGKVWQNIVEEAMDRPRILTLEDSVLPSELVLEPEPNPATSPPSDDTVEKES